MGVLGYRHAFTTQMHSKKGCSDQIHFIDFGRTRLLPQGSAWVSGHIQIAREGVAFGQKERNKSQDSA